MRLLVLTIFLLHTTCCLAQKETSNWFLSGSRVAVTPAGITNVTPTGMSAAFYPYRGSTSISDSAGNLLFATDGRTIINKNLQVMPALNNINLQGQDKLLIAPIPNSSRYYVFYSQPNGFLVNSSWTLKYAIVDLSLQGGLGDVTLYDQVIDTALSKGYTLAQANNGQDIWLVTHRKATTTFLSYKITAAGLNTTPITSTAGSVTIPMDYILHEMKTSHNGKMIAAIAYNDYTVFFAMTWGFLEVFNFNSSLGILTNKIRTNRGSGYYTTFHTLEFSPDDRLLYRGAMSRIYGLQPCGWGAGNITQYNLCYTDTTSFTQYSMLVATTYSFCSPDASWGRIQMGADKKIYMPYSGTTISSINFPNRIGSSSSHQFNAHQVLTSNNAVIVAPTFYHKQIAKAVINNIRYTGGCFSSATSFSITNDTITNIQWNFGDPASGVANTSLVLNPQHIFSSPGFYTVTAQLFTNTAIAIETVTEVLEIKNPSQRLLAAYPTDTTFCSGNTLKLKLNVVNGIFHWTTRSLWNNQLYTLQVADSLYITSSGTYYVEMRQNDCNGCIMIDSIKVNVLPTPFLDLGPNTTLCTGDSLQLTGSDPAATYIWSTGETTRSILVRNGGTYWVQGELNANGCPKRDTIVITALPGVQFALPNDTTLCNNQTLLLSPGVSNASYLWQNGTVQPVFTVTQPGTYWARVTANNGCRRSDTIKVAYVNAQAAWLGNDTTLCAGNSITLLANVPNAGYQWNTGVTTDSIIVTQTGMYWLRVSKGGCTVADTVNITFNPRPVFSLGNDTALCIGQRHVLRSGIANATYQWSNNSTADTLVVSQPGWYWLNITKGGCTVRDSLIVSYKSLPVVNLGIDTAVCTGNTVNLSALHPSIQSYQWQDGSVLSNYTVQTAGTYWVQAKGINGCFNIDTVLVSNKSLPVFSLGSDTTLCIGQAVSYNFNLTNAAYLWNSASTANSSTITTAGLYWLEVTQRGCTKRDSVTINFQSSPVVALGNDTTLCEGTAFQLNAFNTGASYIWNTGDATSAIGIKQPGNYWVRVTLNGCVASDSIRMAFNYLPKFSLGMDTVLCNGQTLNLKPNAGSGQYLWSDASTGTTYMVTQPGTYSLTVTNNCGSATDAITVIKGACQLYMPSAFTPNRDGKNDVFRVKYPQFIKIFRMQVFNRWGEVVYSSTNPYDGWDGRSRGVDQPAGNYVWMISLTDVDGNKSLHKGGILILR